MCRNSQALTNSIGEVWQTHDSHRAQHWEWAADDCRREGTQLAQTGYGEMGRQSETLPEPFI